LLFEVVSAREMPFAMLLYIQCILHGLTRALLCVPSIFAHHKRCRFCNRHMMASISNKNCPLIVASLIAEVLFNSCWFVLLYNRLNIAGNEMFSFQMIKLIVRIIKLWHHSCYLVLPSLTLPCMQVCDGLPVKLVASTSVLEIFGPTTLQWK